MEMMYQYMWKHGMMGEGLQTVDGRKVEVLYAGVHNQDSGPDFLGSRLRIQGQEWAGNVEVHSRASDWFRHGHDSDSAYDNVILHVVGDSDTLIPDGRGGHIPQVIAPFSESMARMYLCLADKIGEIRCRPWLETLSPLAVSDWISTLTVERLQAKARRIGDVAEALGGDWEWACFVALARALGFGLNSEPLEMLARLTPLKFLGRHSDDIMQLEALLFGQAGMLDMSVHIFDEYYQSLCREYFFLARKYSLRPMRRDIWKFSKTRPQNFPTRRIALLASAVHGGFRMLSAITDNECRAEESRGLFDWHMSPYWRTHYDFDVEGTGLTDHLSEVNKDLLMINFMAPVLYAFGAARGDSDMAGRGLEIWESLAPENNRYIRQWTAAGLTCETAADSQAFIQLSREYCDRMRCLECRFGHLLLRSVSQARRARMAHVPETIV